MTKWFARTTSLSCCCCIPPTHESIADTHTYTTAGCAHVVVRRDPVDDWIRIWPAASLFYFLPRAPYYFKKTTAMGLEEGDIHSSSWTRAIDAHRYIPPSYILLSFYRLHPRLLQEPMQQLYSSLFQLLVCCWFLPRSDCATAIHTVRTLPVFLLSSHGGNVRKKHVCTYK